MDCMKLSGEAVQEFKVLLETEGQARRTALMKQLHVSPQEVGRFRVSAAQLESAAPSQIDLDSSDQDRDRIPDEIDSEPFEKKITPVHPDFSM
jgi:hypothetical protein